MALFAPQLVSHRRSRAAGRLVALLLCGSLLGIAAPVRADTPPDESEMRKAEAFATEAKVFFKAGLHERAAQRFMEAFALSKRPSLLFNAARAYEEGGNHREALALFQHYRTLPDVTADGRKDADSHIASLNAALTAAAKTAPPPLPVLKTAPGPDPQPVVKPPPIDVRHAAEPPRKLPVVEMVASGGFLALAGGLYALALHEAGLARALDVRTKQDIQDYLEHAGNARTWRNVAIGGATVGVALGAWAAYDVFRGAAKPGAPKTALAVFPTCDGAQFAWSQTF